MGAECSTTVISLTLVSSITFISLSLESSFNFASLNFCSEALDLLKIPKRDLKKDDLGGFPPIDVFLSGISLQSVFFNGEGKFIAAGTGVDIVSTETVDFFNLSSATEGVAKPLVHHSITSCRWSDKLAIGTDVEKAFGLLRSSGDKFGSEDCEEVDLTDVILEDADLTLSSKFYTKNQN